MFLFCRRTVYNTVRRVQETGTIEDMQRSGRPRVSTARDDRLLVWTSLQNRRETIPSLKASWMLNGVSASASTIRGRLHSAGLRGCVASKKPYLSAIHRSKRLQFARDHESWTEVDWSAVLWTDESRFTLFQNDGRVYVRRRSDEVLLD